ncbi:hypothetical protein F3J14_26415 [Burkholderia sp. Tr-862]|nr:hypothetical protein [Burkholderia sp. Tr-862]
MSHAVAVALFLHLLAVAVWVGGMVFANFCLRPALTNLVAYAVYWAVVWLLMKRASRRPAITAGRTA